MKLIKPVIERSVSSFELNNKANREYNTKLQARFTNSIFTLCAWYRLNMDGRVISIFPGSFSSIKISFPFFFNWFNCFFRIECLFLVVVSTC